MYDSIDINEIDQISINNNLIDIRDKYEYNFEHIKNSINIPYSYLIMVPENYLNINNTYYIYCGSGGKSRKLCEYLTTLGYKAIDLIGGYNNYNNKE